jgi:hypothetical protein
MTIRPDTDELIVFLNSLLKIDPDAVRALAQYRVPCNKALAAHSSVQVAKTTVICETGGKQCSHTVGLLGILNGYAGTLDDDEHRGWGPIAAIFDQGRIVRFQRTDTFKEKAHE